MTRTVEGLESEKEEESEIIAKLKVTRYQGNRITGEKSEAELIQVRPV